MRSIRPLPWPQSADNSFLENVLSQYSLVVLFEVYVYSLAAIAIITGEITQNMGLKAGDPATALFKASNGILAVRS
jgi:molybdopterin-binding protein